MKHALLLPSLASLSLLLVAQPLRADVLATTHADFSAAFQGTGGFDWGYYDAQNSLTAPFTTAGMSSGTVPGIGPVWNGPDSGACPSWTAFQGHPGTGPLRPAVMRYTVGASTEPDHTGSLRLVGRFFDLNHYSGDQGDSEVFISVDADGEGGGSARSLALPLSPVRGQSGIAVPFDITLPSVAPDTAIDFGIYAGNNSHSDATGVVAWLVTGDTAVPTHFLANNYSSTTWPYYNGATDTRSIAFAQVTNGIVAGTDEGSIDTTPAVPYAHAGLLYLENAGSGKVTQFDSVRIDVTTSADFVYLPQLYLLRHNSDPNRNDPSQDERYVQLPVTAVRTAANAAGQPYYTFDLTGLPAGQRTGYGFAVFGKGTYSGGAIAVSEIWAEGTRVSDVGYASSGPAWIEYNGHRYALCFTGGTWENGQAEALTYGAILVSINSAAENDWVFDAFARGGPTVYIGLRQNPLQVNTEPSGGWTWMDGTIMNQANGSAVPGVYKKWHDGAYGGSEPNQYFGTGEDYAGFSPSAFSGLSTWGDMRNAGYPETSNYRGIMELPSAGTPDGIRNYQTTVSAQANIFGAGQFNPVPARDPGTGGVAAPFMPVTAGEKFSLSAVSGSVWTGSETSGPDGTHHVTKRCDIIGVGGVSGYLNRNNSAHLVGVFTANTPQPNTPPRIDFSTAAIGEDFTVLGPKLGQVFFIGDGLTPYGEVQTFIAPPGATKLHLGIPDAYEGNGTFVYTGLPSAYSDNSGSFSARLAVTPTATPQFLDTRFPLSGDAFAFAGGTPPYWPAEYDDGNLPPNVLIDGLGRVQGRPTEEGPYDVTVRTQDSLGVEGTQTYHLNVAAAPSGMIAWWKGDDNLLDSAGDHDVTIQGNANFVPGGVVGNTFVFDGTDDILTVPSASELDLPGDFSIEAWVKLASNTGQEPTIVNKRSTDNREVSYVLFVESDGRLTFASRALDSQSRDWVETTTPSTVILEPDSLWKHVAVTCAGATLKFYLNGTLVHTGTHPARPATTEPLTIGAGSVGGDVVGEWNGAIDEPALYSRALRASEISEIFNAYGLGKVFRTKPSFTDEEFPLYGGGQLTIEGGTGPTFTVTLASGDLPSGITLSDGGLVTGTAGNGAYEFTLRVQDSQGKFSLRSFSGLLQNPVPVLPSITAWWPGDNAVGDIIGGNHAPWSGTAPNYTFGKVGRAFQFNGVNQSLHTTTATEVMNQVPLTIEGWVKPEAHASGSINDPLPPNVICNDKTLYGGHGFGVHIYPNGSKLNVGVQGDGVDFRNVPGVTFTAGQWVHVAVVYTPGNVKTYVNGVEVDDFSYTQDDLEGDSLVRIGRHNDDTGYGTRRFFKGAIDELSLYNAALTEAQVSTIYTAGVGGKARYDGARDFNITAAPQTEDSLWTYGILPAGSLSSSSSFFLYNTLTPINGAYFWQSPSNGVVGANLSSVSAQEYGAGGPEIVTLPGQLRFHPSHPTATWAATLRWKAPAAGRYAVSATFNTADAQNSARKDVHIYHNGVSVTQLPARDLEPSDNPDGVPDGADAIVAGDYMGNGKSLTGMVDVQEGDLVDFIVGPSNDGSSYDSTGGFASVVPLGASLTPVDNLVIETQTPPTTKRLWQFQCTPANVIDGLGLRVQYLEADSPSDWHDINIANGTNEMTPPEEGDDLWTLLVSSLDLPTGNYKFRVVASAPSYADRPGPAFGKDALGETGNTDYIPLSAPGAPPPPPVPLEMPAATKMTYSMGGKANAITTRQGVEAVFTITQPVPKGTPEPDVVVQWSADQSSWDTLSGQTVTMTKPPALTRTVTIRSSRLPAGPAIYFRVLTKGKQRTSKEGPVVNNLLKTIGPINIANGPIWSTFQVDRSSNRTDDTSGRIAKVGQRLIYTLRIRNGGGANATNVKASMTAPTGTKVVAGTSGFTPAYTPTIRTLTWTIPSLPPDDDDTVRVMEVEVTSTTLSLVSFPQASALVTCTEIPKSPPAQMENSKTLKSLDTIIEQSMRLSLEADPRSPTLGQVVNFTLKAENAGNTKITEPIVTFKVPVGMHVKALESQRSSGDFTDTPLANPSLDSNPSLTPFVYLGQQTITWKLGKLPDNPTPKSPLEMGPNTSVTMEFALQVMYDLDTERLENGVWVTNQLTANEYNFTAKRGTATVKAFPVTIKAENFNLSAALPTTRAPNLYLTKSATADGEISAQNLPPSLALSTVDIAGVGKVATALRNTRITYKLKYGNKLYPPSPPGEPADNRLPEEARNAVIRDEIPANTHFIGWIRRDGNLINSSYGFTFRNKDYQIIPSNGEPWNDTNLNGKRDFNDKNANGVFDTGDVWLETVPANYDTNKNKRYDTFTDTKFIELNLGMLPANAGGEITYDVVATGLEGKAIISRGDGSIIPSSAGLHYEGYSIWCENRLSGGLVTPQKLVCYIVKPVVLEEPVIYFPKRPEPGGFADMQVGYRAVGGEGLAMQDVVLKVMIPKYYGVDLNETGAVDTSVPLPLPPNQRRPLKLPKPLAAPIVTTRPTDTLLTFNLGSMPTGRAGVIRVPITLPAAFPTALLTTKGNATGPMKPRVEFTGKARRLSTSASSNTRSISASNDFAAFDLYGTSAHYAAEPLLPSSSGLFVGRTFPLTVAAGDKIDVQIYFGNATNVLLQGGKIGMQIPPGTTLDSYGPVKYYYTGTTPAGDNIYERTGHAAPKVVGGRNVFVIDTLDMAPHTMAAVTVTLRVDGGFSGGSLQEHNLTAWTPNAGSKTAPRMVVDVRRDDFWGAIGKFFSNFIGILFNGLNQEASDALAAHQASFKSSSRQIGIAGADFVHLLNGSVVIPLGGGRTAVIGPSDLVTAASGNIIGDDGAVRIAVGHQDVSGYEITGIVRPGFNPETWRPDQIIRAITTGSANNLVAAGAGNLVAAGGGNLVAAGGGNLVAAGGGNFVDNSTGAIAAVATERRLNLVAAGGGNLVAAGGGNLVAAGGGNLVAAGAGNLVAAGAGNLVAAGAGNLVAAGGGNLVAAGGGNLVAAGGMNFAAADIAKLVGLDSASLTSVPISGASLATSLSAADVMNVLSHNGGTLMGMDKTLLKGPLE